MVVSILIGVLVMCSLLGGDLVWVCAVSVPFVILFHFVVMPKGWGKISKLILRLFLNIPKAVLEGFAVLLWKKGEYFEVLDVDEDEEIIEVLGITLTPRSVVVLSEGDRIHIHHLGRRKS